jgi:hypothetical protein
MIARNVGIEERRMKGEVIWGGGDEMIYSSYFPHIPLKRSLHSVVFSFFIHLVVFLQRWNLQRRWVFVMVFYDEIKGK